MNNIRNLSIYERAVREGNYIVDKKATVRQAATVLKVSKTTLHKDVTKVLENNNDPLAMQVREVLDENNALKHIRGGEATKRKYLKINEK